MCDGKKIPLFNSCEENKFFKINSFHYNLMWIFISCLQELKILQDFFQNFFDIFNSNSKINNYVYILNNIKLSFYTAFV